jgi:hypothetical protein
MIKLADLKKKAKITELYIKNLIKFLTNIPKQNKNRF